MSVDQIMSNRKSMTTIGILWIFKKQSKKKGWKNMRNFLSSTNVAKKSTNVVCKSSTENFLKVLIILKC